MIEAHLDVQHIIRDVRRDGDIVVRRTAGSAEVREKGAEDSGAVKHPTVTSDIKEVEEPQHSNVINLELLPSGQLQLNQEERAHIINFFD